MRNAAAPKMRPTECICSILSLIRETRFPVDPETESAAVPWLAASALAVVLGGVVSCL